MGDRYVLVHEPDYAEAYRLMQAEELLCEAGFVPSEDGTWQPNGEE